MTTGADGINTHRVYREHYLQSAISAQGQKEVDWTEQNCGCLNAYVILVHLVAPLQSLRTIQCEPKLPHVHWDSTAQ